MKRICFAGKFDLSGGGVELMDALHAGKRIGFAIARAMHLARERGLTLEVFCCEHDLLAQLARWLDALEAPG